MRNYNYLSEQDLDKSTAQWLATVHSETTPRPQFVLEPANCALIVVDMLRYFADPDQRCYLPVTALTVWRKIGGTVVYTRHCHNGESDLGLMGKFYSDYIHAGRPEAQIIPALAPVAGESIVPKTTYDAFLNTSLEELLVERDVKQVLITGILTHMCCESTARAAFCRGFEVFVPADGLASNRESRHLASLIAMADCVASVTSCAEVIASCAKSRS